VLTSNVFNRVFHLRLGEATATGVAIEVDQRSYLVTARHFAPEAAGAVDFQFQHEGRWKPLRMNLVAHGPGEIDISVFAPPTSLAERALTLPPDMKGLKYGQDVYFLGYPYGLFGELGALNWHFPMPFVKKAVLSCIESNAAGVRRLYLDGHNNPGFSGGPVVFQENINSPFKIAAIISGFQSVNEPVFENGKQLPATYRYNTGIIIAYSVLHAVELIHANPIGPEVKA
jgi:hypothetical protein